jgi:branched-chain amino acid transport system ATP-binding protein
MTDGAPDIDADTDPATSPAGDPASGADTAATGATVPETAASDTASDGAASGGVLSLRDLVIARGGRPVVHGVSLDVPAGEVTALLGPNGAGKSSVVLAISGVLRPQSGSVELDGEQLTRRRPEQIRRAGVAVVPEGRRLLGDLTVADNLRVAMYTLPGKEAGERQASALEMFPELTRRLGARARSLSGGEQQMLVLAQALVTRPRFVVIDELSLGLAPVVVKRLAPVIGEIADRGVGVLLIEQFAAVALRLAQAAHVMEGGRLHFSGLASELQENPELLHSAYLLSGSRPNGGAAA